MRKITADYIYPLSREPLKDGILIVDDSGEIVDLIDKSSLDYEISGVEEYKGIICPGFVNAHCHLELSYLKNLIPQGTGLNDFILKVEEIKHNLKPETQNSKLETVLLADEEMRNNGIVAVGDISNTDSSYEVKKKSKIKYHNFIEVFGSNPDDAENIFNKAFSLYYKFSKISPSSIVPHSPYSVSSELFEKIKTFNNTELKTQNSKLITIHHQESEDENLYFLNKTGKIAERARLLGIDISKFKTTGLKPLPSISELLITQNSKPGTRNSKLKTHFQLVHNTVSKAEDIEYAINTFPQLWFCMCPNSNMYISSMLPDIPEFINHNCSISIGTDSLASNKSLSVLEELKTISRFYPGIELEELLRWSALNGAEYLMINDTFGSLDKGKKPGINLIENVDLEKVRLTDESRVKVISQI